MASPFLDEADRNAFLAEPRQAIFITHRKDKPPMGVPVWFEWTGEKVLMFADKNTAKVRRIRNDPRASVLVPNKMGETEKWVAFDGIVDIANGGGWDLASRLAPRYWDLDNPERKETFDLWRQAADVFCLLTMVPERIREGN